MTDTDATTETEAPETDEARQALLEAIGSDLGEAVLDSHLVPGRDLCLRVRTDSWSDVGSYLRNAQRFRFFNWLSAIDWMPSPFGRSMDAEVDKILGMTDDEASDPVAMQHGQAGGTSRFQVLARVHNLSTDLGLTVKVDVSDDLAVASWTHEYPGADWHEREAYEMFGIHFVGHPGLRNIYLPGAFEGHPLRKDFPLVARLVKPWPGIVDVELMPELEGEDPPAAVSTDNPEVSGPTDDASDGGASA